LITPLPSVATSILWWRDEPANTDLLTFGCHLSILLDKSQEPGSVFRSAGSLGAVLEIFSCLERFF
jgi:hypothetical protein